MNCSRPYCYPPQSKGDCAQNMCRQTTALPKNPVVAMSYIPYQECNDVYPPDKALAVGTIFPVLDKPFLAGWCR